MDTILPCPFCGEQPKASNSYKKAFACQTTGCAMGGQSIHINMWNRRTQPSAPVQPEIRDYIAITNKHIDAADEIILYIKDCKSEFIECTPLASILAKRFREGEIV